MLYFFIKLIKGYWMFTVLCLVTFGVFIGYWIAEIICCKLIAYVKKDNSKKQIHATTASVQQTHIEQLQTQQQVQTQQQYKINWQKPPQIQSKLTATTTISSIDSSKIPSDQYDHQKIAQQQNQQIYVQTLKVNPSQEYQNSRNQLSNASAMNQLNVAMIQDKIQDQSNQQINNQIQNLDQVINPADKIQQFVGLFSTINKQVEVNNLPITSNIQNYKQSNLQNEPQSPPLLHTSYQRRQQRSQLELIQQLTTQKIPQKTQHTDFQIIPQIQKKQQQNDPIQQLIQQIDQLFLNNQEQFIKIINKYKVNQARYTNNSNEEQYKNQGQKIERLENQLGKKNQEIDIMQIQIYQYKTTNNQMQIQLFNQKNNIKQLNQKIKLLQQQNQNLQSNYQTIKNTICPQPQIQPQNISQLTQQDHANKNTVYIKILQQQLTYKQDQIDKLKQQLLFQQQQIQKLHHNVLQINNINNQNQKLYKQKQQEIQIKNQIIGKLRKQVQDNNLKIEEYEKELQKNKDNQKQYETEKEKEKDKISQQMYIKLNQFEKQIHKIRQQAAQQKNKYEQALKNSRRITQQTKQKLDFVKQPQYTYIPMSTRQNLPQNHTSQQITVQNKTQRSTTDLQKINQNLKNQIQFAQTQIRMFEQSQSLYLKQIQQMQQHIQSIQSKHKKQITQLRSKITRLQPVTNQFQIIQKRYFQLKLKYDKLLLQKSKTNNSGSNNISNSHVNIDKKQQLVSSIIHKYSPNNSQKISVFNPDSPINNFSNESKSSPIGHYKFLSDCAFIQIQHRQFLYEIFRKQLKGVIRTQKLYNSKTNKSKNPHELIDNIRNILIIIHLQNDRIIGAYTQQSFSATHPQSTKDNFAFIIDITNHRYFINKTGLNSTNYNAKSLTWGFNQIMIKYQQMDILYTNFCRDHNIYWDGRYRIEDFIGVDKQWARINQYEIFRVSKI